MKDSELSAKGELEKMLRKYSKCYSRSKNDCGKVDCKYQHVIQGGVPPPPKVSSNEVQILRYLT